ncbi:hypothetical protein HPB50_019167 [Hyalomma asiaticum]|uniref:Uncharacterized protein n=1 Tax=Hyalomma asiaticum TaxID=266040 RepID=A0ACB7T3J9_HYAAI|nr:hypothetical protein HPB50_019167 [Hyalomma asiaticum]
MDGKEAFRRRHLLSGGCTGEEEETDPKKARQDSDRLDIQPPTDDGHAVPSRSTFSGNIFSADPNNSGAGTALVNQSFPGASGEESSELQGTMDGSAALVCDICKFAFKGTDDLEKHTSDHVAGKRHQCSTCVVVVEKGNDVAKIMITETLNKAADAGVTYSLVELDPEEFKASDAPSLPVPNRTSWIDAVRIPGSTVHKLSTTVRDTARRMGLPTLSLTYSVYNDYTLSGWDHLTLLEREYLIHVTPPGESYTQVIRDLCEKMDPVHSRHHLRQ